MDGGHAPAPAALPISQPPHRRPETASPRQRQPAVIVGELGGWLRQRTFQAERVCCRFHSRQQLEQAVGQLLLPQRLPTSTHLAVGRWEQRVSRRSGQGGPMTAAGGAVGWEARALARKGHTAGGGRLSQFKTRPHVQGAPHVQGVHVHSVTAIAAQPSNVFPAHHRSCGRQRKRGRQPRRGSRSRRKRGPGGGREGRAAERQQLRLGLCNTKFLWSCVMTTGTCSRFMTTGRAVDGKRGAQCIPAGSG